MNIFGDKTLDDINDKINNLTNILNNQKHQQFSQDNDQINSELLSVFNNDNNDMNKILTNIAVPQDRLARYNIYDEMYTSVPLVKRMISVYISNIMSKNPITSQAFIYKDLKENADEVIQEKSKKICIAIVDHFKLEDKLKTVILPNKLTYGDFFVEVLDISNRMEKLNLKKNVANSIILEEFISQIPKDDSNLDYYLRKASKYLVDIHDTSDELNSLHEELVLTESDTATKSEDLNFNNILLRYHKPHKIIILNTKYGMCLGYLEVLESPNSSAVITVNSMVQKITNVSGFTGKSQSDKIINKLIYFMTKRIFKLNNKKESLVDSLDDESLNLIKRLFIEQDLDTQKNKYQKINVRFISVNNMVHFKGHGSVEYTPFSRSVIDPLVFVGKLYMLTQLSNAITKLSRSAAIRKWTIDPGTSRMTGQMVNRLKRELYNTRVTINDLGSFKSMANILSDFKDMFVVQQNGRIPVDVSIEQLGDPNIKVQDLQDLRQELISLSGIPAVYLGYQDSVELKEQLMHINVSFATEIIDMQENDVRGINKLISMICRSSNLIKNDPTKFIQVSLLPPIVLIVQLIESTLGSVGNITSIFQNMNIKIDPFYFLEQYIQQIDWVKFKKSATEYNEKQKLQTKIESNGQTNSNNSGY